MHLHITNPDKLLWPAAGITKQAYIDYLLTVAPVLLPYARDRLLMAWRWPDGAGTRRIEEKEVPSIAPAWLPRARYKEYDWILLNDPATLAWVGNRAGLELHVPFDRITRPDHPTDLVFDLDPPEAAAYHLACEVALTLKTVLDGLGLTARVKTSGATGLQVYVAIVPDYPYDQARRVNRFIAEYVQVRMPERVTLERTVSRRGARLYFDYLQLWKMRTMSVPYSARATPLATVSAPLTWDEVAAGTPPAAFTIATMPHRLTSRGDLFAPGPPHRLEPILAFLDQHGR